MSELRRRLMTQNWENTPIHFDNQDLKRFCVENFGGENGITDNKYGLTGVRGCAGEFTFKQAAAVTNTEDYVNLHSSLKLDVIDLSLFVNVKQLDGTLRDKYKIQRFVCPPNLERLGGWSYFLYQYKCHVVIPKSVIDIPNTTIGTLKEPILQEGNPIYTQTEEGYIMGKGMFMFMPYKLDAYIVIPRGIKVVEGFVLKPNIDTLVIPPTMEDLFVENWNYQIIYGNSDPSSSRHPRTLVIFNKSLSLGRGYWGLTQVLDIYVPDELVQWYKDSITTYTVVRDKIHPISEYSKLDYLKTKINIEEYGRLD